MNIRTTGIAVLGAALTCVGAMTSAEAQLGEAPAAESGPADRISYGASFFAAYSVNNAEDMLRLIPGAQSILNVTTATNTPQRGFGSGGAQILVNGRRFPGKSNEITTNLRRITAVNVARVEVISGAVEGIAVQSSGILVNIVLREGASLQASGSWELAGRLSEGHQPMVDGLLSYKGALGGLSYTAGVQREVWSQASQQSNRYSDRLRDEVYFFPNGAVQELRTQHSYRDINKWTYTGGLTYDFKGGQRAELNAFHQTLAVHEDYDTPFTRVNQAGAVTLSATDILRRFSKSRDNSEISGEYQAPLWGGDLDALFIVRAENFPNNEVRTLEIGPRLIEVGRNYAIVDTGETIGRAVYSRGLGAGQSIEIGGEFAKNTLDQELHVYFDRNGDDRVEEVFVPTANAEVEELRGEAFVKHKWLVSSRLSLESELSYEKSYLTNNYPFSPERNLGFLKPRLDARYRVSGETQLRVLIERTVSQLDFNNFVPKFDFVDNEIDAGNPALEPEKTWTSEIGYERRLPGGVGLLEGRIYYNDITGAIDKVPLRDATGFYSALGNLPSAERYGAEVKASLRLGLVGLDDALLSLRYQVQKSETIDPFSGAARRLANDRGNNYEVTFRHDLRALGASYGFSTRDVGGVAVTSDLTVTSFLTVEPTYEAFLEKRIVGTTVLRVEAQNFMDGDERQDRAVYNVNALQGALRRYEHFDERRHVRLAVRLRGTF